MQALELVLPALATAALGTALLVPLRDDRRGRRATVSSGTTPLRAEFIDRAAAESAQIRTSDDAPSHAAGAAPPNEHALEVIAGSPLASPLRADARTTVLDPFAFLTALAQPLVSARDAYVRFVSGASSASASRDTDTAEASANPDAGPEHVSDLERAASTIERSFASEFASLLGSAPGLARTVSNAAEATHADRSSANASIARNVSDASAPTPANDAAAAPAASDERATSRGDDIDIDTATERETYEHRIVLRPASPHTERAVPLTRLPLRPQGEITWTSDIDVAGPGVTPSRTQRHAFLDGCVRDASTVSGTILERAYRQEDVAGRTIALHALVRWHPADGREIFVEALRIGSDEERALAIDGLTEIGARTELLPAFGDRVDAVAAKAALAYVGSRSRSEYRAELAPYVEAAQLDKILTLLAGIIE